MAAGISREARMRYARRIANRVRLGRRPNADGFALAALRVLDALQPRPVPDDTSDAGVEGGAA